MGLNVKQALLTTTLALVSLHSFASNWFEIELVLFERHGEVSNEQWRQDAPDIDTSKTLDFISSLFIVPECPNVAQSDIRPVIADLIMIPCAQVNILSQPIDIEPPTEIISSEYQALMSDSSEITTKHPLNLPPMFSVNGINYRLKAQKNKLPITMASEALATELIKPHLLDQPSLQLTTLVKKLRWQKNLTPKLHLGWRQEVLPRHLAKPIRLIAGQKLNDDYQNTAQGGWEFDGLFKVYLNHYLFIETNINHKMVSMVEVEQLDQEMLIQSPTSISLLHTEMVTAAESIQPVSVPWLINHNLKQHRRVKSKELHYFDHPDFGLVVQIRRFTL